MPVANKHRAGERGEKKVFTKPIERAPWATSSCARAARRRRRRRRHKRKGVSRRKNRRRTVARGQGAQTDFGAEIGHLSGVEFPGGGGSADLFRNVAKPRDRCSENRRFATVGRRVKFEGWHARVRLAGPARTGDHGRAIRFREDPVACSVLALLGTATRDRLDPLDGVVHHDAPKRSPTAAQVDPTAGRPGTPGQNRRQRLVSRRSTAQASGDPLCPRRSTRRTCTSGSSGSPGR